MASSKYKVSLKKKLNSELSLVLRSLRRERDDLRKTLTELSWQLAQLYQLVERIVSLETVRQENWQHQTEQRSRRDGSLVEEESISPAYVGEVETPGKQVVSVSARCQHLEKDVAGTKDFMPNAQGSTPTVEELQNLLRDALEKNKQWLEYDQHREAYVRGILDRMLWLEKQLNEANHARSKQHKEDHSDEKKEVAEMQELYERFLQKAKDDLEELRNEVDLTHKNLLEMREISLLQDHCCFENEDQQLKDFQCRLEVEKRRSANFELQANLIQKSMLNRHHEDQEKIAELERQMKISSQDLEDEKQDCSYLKKQMIRVLKALQKTKEHVTKELKRDQQDPHSCEEAQPPSQVSRQSLASSSCSSFLNESFLECPGCQAEYPASHYRELMSHMEICLD